MQIFKEEERDLQVLLDTKGFVKLQLLPAAIVSELLDIYNNNPNPKNPYFGFHVTLDLSAPEKINDISRKIDALIRPYAGAFLENFQFISPRFAVKEPNRNSHIPPHQDWSFVDESVYQSYNLWIALTPSTLDNGTLGFLKGSHNILTNIRATPLPIFQVPFHDYAYELSDELEYISLAPGEAFLFNSRIIHASHPNTTDKSRINIAVEITSDKAALQHYYLSPVGNKIESYTIDGAFFTKYSNAKLTEMYKQHKTIPDYTCQETIPNNIPKIKKADLLSQCSKY